MKEKEELTDVSPFDLMESKEDAVNFLRRAMMDKDPTVFQNTLKYSIEFFGTAAVAKSSGLNRENLYKISRGKRNPRYMTFHKLIQAIINLADDYIKERVAKKEESCA